MVDRPESDPQFPRVHTFVQSLSLELGGDLGLLLTKRTRQKCWDATAMVTSCHVRLSLATLALESLLWT